MKFKKFCSESVGKIQTVSIEVMHYRIAQMLGWGKPWWITGGLPNFTIQILTMSRDIYEESKQAGIRQSFLCQKFALYSICYHDVGKFMS